MCNVLHVFLTRDGFHGIICPPIPNIGLMYIHVDDKFFLPSVILWNPLITHPNVVNSLFQTCTTCEEDITLSSWNDQSKQPRKLQSIEGVTLLIP